MDDPLAWAESLIAVMTWTGGILPFALWKVVVIVGAAVWVVFLIRAWRSGR